MKQGTIIAILEGNGSDPENEGFEKETADVAAAKWDDDLSLVEREIERNSESWEAWSARADILLTLGRYAESLQSCDRSLALNPEVPLSWATKGDILCRMERCDEAAKCYRRAAQLDPVYLVAWRRPASNRSFQTQ